MKQELYVQLYNKEKVFLKNLNKLMTGENGQNIFKS